MISLFKWLPEDVVQWFVANSTEMRVEPRHTLIRENTQIDSLYIVLSGVLGVYVSAAGNKRVGTLGAGTVLGEISFIDDAPSSATVIVEEKSLLLQVARAKLSEQIAVNPRFAAEFYKGLAATMSEKLRKSNEKLAAFQDAEKEEEGGADGDLLEASEKRVAQFKRLILQADHDAQTAGRVSPETYTILRDRFTDILHLFHDSLGEASEIHRYYKEQIGARLQHELLPLVLMADTAGRCYSKPRGYAEDFEVVERIYRNEPSGKGRTGPVIDRLFLDTPIAASIRSRRKILSREITKAVAGARDREIALLCVGCGPARELHDVFNEAGNKTQVRATLMDNDSHATAFVRAWATELKRGDAITILNDNIINLALGKSSVSIPPQDFIYSAGLLDYFDDRMAVKLLNFLHALLKPDGRLLLGGFHPDNVCKEFMEYVLEWHIIHRGEKDLDNLFTQSAFAGPGKALHKGDDGVCVVAEAVRA